MDRQLARDMAILVTARAARDAGYSVDAYVGRYAEEEKDREYILEYLSLMELVNHTWKPKSMWQMQDYDDKGEYIYVWSEA